MQAMNLVYAVQYVYSNSSNNKKVDELIHNNNEEFSNAILNISDRIINVNIIRILNNIGCKIFSVVIKVLFLDEEIEDKDENEVPKLFSNLNINKYLLEIIPSMFDVVVEDVKLRGFYCRQNLN